MSIPTEGLPRPENLSRNTSQQSMESRKLRKIPFLVVVYAAKRSRWQNQISQSLRAGQLGATSQLFLEGGGALQAIHQICN